MILVLLSEETNSAIYHVIPLTKDVIKEATYWLHGIDWARSSSPKNEMEVEDRTVKTLLEDYPVLLQEKILKENSFEGLINFIRDHKWSTDSWRSKNEAFGGFWAVISSRQQTNTDEL